MTTLKCTRFLKQIKGAFLITLMLLASCDEEPEGKPVGVYFSSDQLSLMEGNTTIATLVFSTPATRDGFLQLSIQTDAIYGQDYNIMPTPAGGFLTLNIKRGQRGVQFQIIANDNNAVEIHSPLVFQINSSSGGFTLLNPTRLTVTINDDESIVPEVPEPNSQLPLVTFEAAQGSVSEGESNGVAIKVSLLKFQDDEDGGSFVPTTATGDVLVKIASGHADYGKEFTTSPAATENSVLLKFTGTQTDTSLTVIPVDNFNFTGSRFISFTISQVTGDIQTGFNTQYWLEIKEDESGPGNVTWTKLNSPVTTDIQKVEFYDENNGYIMTNNKIRKTTDGGLNWTDIQPDASKEYVQVNFHFLSEQVGFASGTEYTCDYYDYDCVVASRIFSTANGGTKWTLIKEFNSGLVITSLYFISQSTGFIGTENGQILRTLDGGATWTAVSLLTLSPVYDLVLLSDGTGYARSHDRILKTTDSGASWTTSFITPGNFAITSLAQSSTKSLSATWQECADLPDGFRLIHKSDDGINWTPVTGCTLAETVSLSSTAPLGASLGRRYLVGWTSSIQISQDNGLSWNLEELPEETTALWDIEVASDKVIYAVGSEGLILKGVVQ